MKKTALYFSSFVVAAALVIVGIASFAYPASAQTTNSSLTGWAWSDNIGWISFNCLTGGSSGGNICGTSAYGVSADASGNLTGYAWSDNIGWIKFGGLTGFPNTTYGTNAQMSSGGAITGWARACTATIKSGDSPTAPTQIGDCSTMTSRADGWDGWLSFSGVTTVDHTNYGVTYNSSTGLYNGYAWGDVIGWLSFNTNSGTPTNPCNVNAGQVCNTAMLTPSVTLTTSPSAGFTSTSSSQTATLSWTTANVSTCNITGDLSLTGVATTSSPSHAIGPFPTTGTRNYTITCHTPYQAGGSDVTASAAFSVTATGGNPGNNPPGSCPAVQNAYFCDGAGSVSNVINSCSAGTNPVNACEWACNTGFARVGHNCVLNSTVQEK